MNADSSSDRNGLKTFESMIQNHLELVRDLQSEVQKFAKGRSQFTSTEAGNTILSQWSRTCEWNRIAGSKSKEAFGWACFYALKLAWDVTADETTDGYPVKTYRKRQSTAGA